MTKTIGQWRSKFTSRELEVIDYSVYKANRYPNTSNDHEVIIKKMANLLERIHFAMAPLSDSPEFAVETKKKIKEILGY